MAAPNPAGAQPNSNNIVHSVGEITKALGRVHIGQTTSEPVKVEVVGNAQAQIYNRLTAIQNTITEIQNMLTAFQNNVNSENIQQIRVTNRFISLGDRLHYPAGITPEAVGLPHTKRHAFQMTAADAETALHILGQEVPAGASAIAMKKQFQQFIGIYD